jgi:ACS family tartrate transporter-like MFS transporter
MSIIEPVPLSTCVKTRSSSVDATIGRSALRKASLRLLPLIFLGYGINYIDRTNISFASLHMNRDLHFSASIYGLGAGLFFLTYAAFELPSNLMLVRFGARRWLARIMFTWGLLAIGMMFVKTPMQFYAMRLLLGAAEAGFAPGVIFYLTLWFPPAMRAHAVSRFFIAAPLSFAVSGVVAGPLLDLQGHLGLAGWQWLFLVEGVPAILLSVIFLAYLPNNPAEARWLTDDERTWIHRQLHSGRTPGAAIQSDELGRAFRDARVWLLGLFNACILCCSFAYTFSAPAIIQKLTGFSITYVGFIVATMSLFNALCVILISMHSDRTRERFLHLAIPCLLAATGWIVGGFSTAPLLAIPAFWVSQICLLSVQPVMFSLPADFLTARSAAAGIGVICSVGILGAFLGPVWMGRMRDLSGSYQLGIVALAGPSLLASGIIFYLRRQSRNVRVTI